MQYIDFKVQHQTITRTDNYEVVGGSQNYLRARFTLCDEWADIIPTAVFSTNSGKHYGVEVKNGECVVPWEVLTGAEFWVGVFGGERMTTSTVRVQVKPGVKLNASPGVQPTPSAYEELMGELREGMAHIDEQKEAAEGAAALADSAKDSVLAALNNVPEGSTVIVNDLATGGTSAALSAEMGKVLAKRPSPNLLHNWYFKRAVNRRGKASYTDVGYTLDRWAAKKASAVTSLKFSMAASESGLVFTNNSTGGSVYCVQTFEEALPPGEYTLSILVTKRTGTAYIGFYKSSGGAVKYKSISGKGVTSLTYTITEADQAKAVRITAQTGASVTVDAIKLELGGVQTLAHWNGSSWVLNEIPDYNEELAKCCASTADETDLYANNYRAIYTDSGTVLHNRADLVDEMVAVARSYYEQDKAYFKDKGERYFGYYAANGCFDQSFATAEGNYVDCSTFAGLILRGIPYSKSPYVLDSASRTGWDKHSVVANNEDYCWAVNPFEWEMPAKVGGETSVRSAAQICQWLMSLGCAVTFKSDFSNVDPGDFIFYAKVNANSEFKEPDRFMNISHVAFCATKEDVTDEDTDFSGYKFKHQIYDATIKGENGSQTFFYDDDAEGIVSTRYLETTSPESVIAICRPLFLSNVNGVVNPVIKGGTGASTAGDACYNLGAATRPNLLHNWYFAKPVNQRGKTEYTDMGYTIDRWESRVASGVEGLNFKSEIVANGGIKLTNSSTKGFVYSLQMLEEALLPGDYTLSALVTNKSGTVYIGLYNENMGAPKYDTIKGDGLFSITRSITAADASRMIRIGLTKGASVTISAIKLEKGNSQTLAHKDSNGNWVLNDVPEFGDELLKCQRYYQLFSTEDKRPAALVDYRPSMLKEPTLGTVEIDGTTYYYAEANP